MKEDILEFDEPNPESHRETLDRIYLTFKFVEAIIIKSGSKKYRIPPLPTLDQLVQSKTRLWNCSTVKTKIIKSRKNGTLRDYNDIIDCEIKSKDCMFIGKSLIPLKA